MSTSPNPQNLLILAAVGIGIFWFTQKKAVAAPVRPALTTGASAAQQQESNTFGALGRVLGALPSALKGLSGLGAGASAAYSATPFKLELPSWGSNVVTEINPFSLGYGLGDSVAANPAGLSIFDYFSTGQ